MAKVPELDKYHEGMEKASVEVFVKTARDAIYEFPDIELDDVETMLHCACLKMETMQKETDRVKKENKLLREIALKNKK